jgi:hypothetical protein
MTVRNADELKQELLAQGFPRLQMLLLLSIAGLGS